MNLRGAEGHMHLLLLGNGGTLGSVPWLGVGGGWMGEQPADLMTVLPPVSLVSLGSWAFQ